jgi:hypothetical protein
MDRHLGRTYLHLVAGSSIVAVGIGFVALAMESMTTSSATVDEFAHLPAGVSHWETGDYTIYCENPPFVRCLLSLPAWLSGPRLSYRKAAVGSGRRNEWAFGADFLILNLERYDRLLFRARCVVLALSLGCCLVIHQMARACYGHWAACLASFLWLTDPNVLAHSGVATLDVGAALAGCLATYVFLGFLRGPTWPMATLAGTLLGLAQASKFSSLALYPAWLVIFLVARWRLGARPGGDRPARRPGLGQGAVIVALSVLTLDACYQFRGAFRPLGGYAFKSRLLTGGESSMTPGLPGVPGGNRFRGAIWGLIPIPLPEDYVIGFDSQKCDEEAQLANLRDGHVIVGGPWYGPLRTLALKLPPGTLMLLAAAALSALGQRSPFGMTDLVVAAPAVALLGLLCTQTGLNWAIRYTLPAMPFLFIAVAGALRTAWASRRVRLFLVVCLMWNIAEVLGIRPFYLSYGNPLVGGMDGAQRTFLGSNYDWGQDLHRLRRWCEANREKSRRTFLFYYGPIDPRLIGISGLPGFPDAGTKNGLAAAARRGDAGPYYFLVSSNFLNGATGSYLTIGGMKASGRLVLVGPPGELRPVERVGSSLFLFRSDRYQGEISIKADEAHPTPAGMP